MGKKFTFWGMLAAMMLSIPAQSQTILKSAAPKQTTAVTQQAFKAKTSAKARKAKNMPADAAERQYAPGTNMPFTGLRAATSSVVGHSFRDIKPEGEEKDAHGIIVTPAKGAHSFYSRSGFAYYVSGSQMAVTEQTEAVEIVECAEGTVYVKDIISMYATGAWVKGKKNGNTITIPAGQPIAYDDEYQATLSVRWGLITAEGSLAAADDHAEAFTFTIDGDEISLQGTDAWQQGVEAYYMAVLWDDDNSASGYGDYLTVWNKLDVRTQIDELPYVNDFQTLGQRCEFSWIDANADGKTWHFAHTTDEQYFARYSYSSSLNADDWLFSPAIKLEAGKQYRLAFLTRNADTNERLEVKLGDAATVEAMKTQVIESTDITWSEFATIENTNVTVDKTGYYYFGIHANSDADAYRLYVDDFTVEVIDVEAPAAISDLTAVATPNVLEATITFTAPATKINGEPLTTNLTKIELLRNGEVIKTFEDVAPGTQLTYVDNDPALIIGTYTYQVLTYNDHGIGQKGAEVSVFLSTILDVPYTADLTDEATFSTYSVIDANEDGRTWNYDISFRTNYAYNGDAAADDYLITPGLRLKAGKNYSIQVNALCWDYPERFEVKIGKVASVEGLTTTILEPVEVNNTEDAGEIYEGVFSVADDDVYYVAVHAISDADQYHLTLNSLAVVDGPAATAPAAPTVSIQADAKGEHIVNIDITAPTVAVDGSALTENVNIEILRNGEVVKTVEGVAPGAATTFVDEPAEAGLLTYQLIPYNASGAGLKTAKITVFVGMDLPLVVENLTAADNATSVTLNWNKVGEEGVNGLYVNPAKVDYTVWTTAIEESWFGSMLVLDQQIGSVRDADTFSFNFNTDEGDQQYAYWAVQTSTADGVNEEAASVGMLVGKPYDLPVKEDVADGSFHYYWNSDALLLSYQEPESDDVSIVITSEQEGEVYFNSGKLNLKDAVEPMLSFDVRASGITSLNITAGIDGAAQQVIATVPVSEELSNVKVPLSAFKGGRYAIVGITAQIQTPTETDFWTGDIVSVGDFCIVDNVFVEDNKGVGIAGVTVQNVPASDVYSLDGRLVRSNTANLSGLKGLYISNGKKLFVK